MKPRALPGVPEGMDLDRLHGPHGTVGSGATTAMLVEVMHQADFGVEEVAIVTHTLRHVPHLLQQLVDLAKQYGYRVMPVHSTRVNYIYIERMRVFGFSEREATKLLGRDIPIYHDHCALHHS